MTWCIASSETLAYLPPGAGLGGIYLKMNRAKSQYLIPGVALGGFYLKINTSKILYLTPGVRLGALHSQNYAYLSPGVYDFCP